MRKGAEGGYRDLTKRSETSRSDVFSSNSQIWQEHNQHFYLSLAKVFGPPLQIFLSGGACVSDVESSSFYTLRIRKHEVQQTHLL